MEWSYVFKKLSCFILCASSICFILLFNHCFFFSLHVLLAFFLACVYCSCFARVLFCKHFFLAMFFFEIASLHSSSHHSLRCAMPFSCFNHFFGRFYYGTFYVFPFMIYFFLFHFWGELFIYCLYIALVLLVF